MKIRSEKLTSNLYFHTDIRSAITNVLVSLVQIYGGISASLSCVVSGEKIGKRYDITTNLSCLKVG